MALVLAGEGGKGKGAPSRLYGSIPWIRSGSPPWSYLKKRKWEEWSFSGLGERKREEGHFVVLEAGGGQGKR